MVVNREQFYAIMGGEGTLDYELYLNTKSLLSCQTKFDELCSCASVPAENSETGFASE